MHWQSEWDSGSISSQDRVRSPHSYLQMEEGVVCDDDESTSLDIKNH